MLKKYGHDADLTDEERTAILNAAREFFPEVYAEAIRRMEEEDAREVQRAMGPYACIVCGRSVCCRDH